MPTERILKGSRKRKRPNLDGESLTSVWGLHLYMPTLAFFLTFSSYGTHIPGSEKGWVTAQRNVYGSLCCNRIPAARLTGKIA
jgi:hypothetical protein